MKLCVALDMETKDENLNLAKELKDLKNIWFKVGLRTFIRDGNSFIENLKHINKNAKIFLDLKLYDIPSTMQKSAKEIIKLPIDMFNIHASSGEKAISMVAETIYKSVHKPLLFTVSALTSFNDEDFKNIYGDSIKNKIRYFSKISYKNRADGMVCSVWESQMIKNNTSKKFLTLTPGIKVDNIQGNDQKRVASIENANKEKSDFIVVGRPIYNSSNPYLIAKQIINTIQGF